MIYDRMNVFEQKPTIHQIKSHVTPKEIVGLYRTYKDIVKSVISNEAADAAAGAVADHQGDHKKILDDEGKAIAQLWGVMRRMRRSSSTSDSRTKGYP